MTTNITTKPTTRTTGSSANGKSKMLTNNNNNNYNNNDNNNNNNRDCKYSSKRRKVKTNIISRKTRNKSKNPKHYSSSLKTQFQVIFLYSFLSYFHQTIFVLTFFLFLSGTLIRELDTFAMEIKIMTF